VPELRGEDELSGSSYVILILRLVLDENARLRYGELVDAGGVCEARFADLHGLLEAVRLWLDRQRVDHQ
jgi:hypothetical protein